MKTAHKIFPELKLTFFNCLICLTTSPKQKQFTIMYEKVQQLTLTFEKLEAGNFGSVLETELWQSLGFIPLRLASLFDKSSLESDMLKHQSSDCFVPNIETNESCKSPLQILSLLPKLAVKPSLKNHPIGIHVYYFLLSHSTISQNHCLFVWCWAIFVFFFSPHFLGFTSLAKLSLNWLWGTILLL